MSWEDPGIHRQGQHEPAAASCVKWGLENPPMGQAGAMVHHHLATVEQEGTLQWLS